MIISMMLVCSVLAALAFGVLTAYVLCLGFFRLMRMHGPATVSGHLDVKHAEAVSKL